jgi:hypothetical protein
MDVRVRFDLSPLARERGFRWPLPAFELPDPLPTDVRRLALRAWEDRTRSEYVGVMTVRKLHGLLVDLNAPMDLQRSALDMMLEEQEHAMLCAAAAEALGGEGEIGFPLTSLQQPRDERPLEEKVLALLIRSFLVGEVVAMALIRFAVRAVPKTGFRTVLERIQGDELRHGRFGAPVLSAIREGLAPRWLEYPGDAWIRAEVDREIARMEARDVVEPDEAALFEDPEARGPLLLVGIPPSDAFVAEYFRALAQDVPEALRSAGLEHAA